MSTLVLLVWRYYVRPSALLEYDISSPTAVEVDCPFLAPHSRRASETARGPPSIDGDPKLSFGTGVSPPQHGAIGIGGISMSTPIPRAAEYRSLYPDDSCGKPRDNKIPTPHAWLGAGYKPPLPTPNRYPARSPARSRSSLSTTAPTSLSSRRSREGDSPPSPFLTRNRTNNDTISDVTTRISD